MALNCAGRLGAGPSPACVKYGAVEISPYLNDARAAASISADFELAWAWREWGIERAEEMGLMERRNIPLILELLEDLGIPITFATVGHLFLESCGVKGDGVAHPTMPRPHLNRRWQGDWYQHDPAGSLCTHPAWYCPDLIRSIQKSRSPHEIGCHTFSHIEFSPECSNEELVMAEIRESQKAMEEFGIQLRTLVYPFNVMGHQYLTVLSTLGVVAVRHRDTKLALAYPERDSSGVYKIYETMGLRQSKYFDQSAKALILLEEAAKRRLCYHLWFHPSDPTERFQTIFHEILGHMARLRKGGELWVATMQGLTAYCEARRTTTVENKWDGERLIMHFRSTYDRDKYGLTELTLRVQCQKRPLELKLCDDRTTKILTEEEFRYCDKSGTLVVNVPCDTRQCELSMDR